MLNCGRPNLTPRFRSFSAGCRRCRRRSAGKNRRLRSAGQGRSSACERAEQERVEWEAQALKAVQEQAVQEEAEQE